MQAIDLATQIESSNKVMRKQDLEGILAQIALDKKRQIPE